MRLDLPFGRLFRHRTTKPVATTPSTAITGDHQPVVLPITPALPQHRQAPVLDDSAKDRQAAVEEAVRVIQEHLDLEAANRRLTSLDPRDLCPMQKAEMVRDLTTLLGRP